MSFLRELMEFMLVRKKYWLIPSCGAHGFVRRPHHGEQGLCGSALYLHHLLVVPPAEKVMRVLGVSAFYHDSAAALVDDGRIVAAAQEERFTRKKHDARFPRHAIAYCLREAGGRSADVDYVVFYDKPFLKFERLLETYLAFAPRGSGSFRMAMPLWMREKLFQKRSAARRVAAARPGFDWQAACCSPSIT